MPAPLPNSTTAPAADSGDGLACPIRRALLEDAGAVAELAAVTFIETFGHLYPPEDLREFLAKAHCAEHYRRLLQETTTRIWVAQRPEGELLGYVVAGKCKLPVDPLPPHSGELRQLYVRAAAQQQKLGSRLFAVALEWLQEYRFEPLYIGVWSENFGAQRFYARHGFQKIGEYDFPVGATIDREFILRRP